MLHHTAQSRPRPPWTAIHFSSRPSLLNDDLHLAFLQQGFDEFMNLVLDDAEEVYIEKSGRETKARQDLGK